MPRPCNTRVVVLLRLVLSCLGRFESMGTTLYEPRSAEGSPSLNRTRAERPDRSMSRRHHHRRNEHRALSNPAPRDLTSRTPAGGRSPPAGLPLGVSLILVFEGQGSGFWGRHDIPKRARGFA